MTLLKCACYEARAEDIKKAFNFLSQGEIEELCSYLELREVILHGHPKFSVIFSLLCEETDCIIEDCWKDCDKVRHLGVVPVVAGEVGAGGIAKNVPPVIGDGIAVVYGHGVFATGSDDFRQPLAAMISLENWCRRKYLHRLKNRKKMKCQESL